MPHYDAAVVGAGPNGLSAAVELTRSGRRVLVLEGSDVIGGGTRTESLTLPGFMHDMCSAIHPMGAASPFFRSIGIGDKTLMMPDMGFVVGSIDEGRSIVSVLEDGSTSWCLGLYPNPSGGTRLVSRWRPKFDVTPATVAMTALAEPGTFIMERKMLRTIRDRAEISPVVPPPTE